MGESERHPLGVVEEQQQRASGVPCHPGQALGAKVARLTCAVGR
ncbi:hypothetical protein ACFQ0G_17300 [Streptomyces chiangmaiensis]